MLKFNTDKCHVLTLGVFNNIRYTHRYTLYKEELEHVFEEKDLGVIIDMSLTFEEHISSKIKKANNIMGLIRRSFSYLDCDTFRKLYTTLVCPYLEYAQSTWSPHLRKYIKQLENVQIRATKYVDGLKNLEYEERLKKLNLPTLLHRRLRGDMIEMWKHFNKYDRQTLSKNFKTHSRANRRHNLQLIWNNPKDGKRGLQANSFYFRSAPIWNKLPAEVVISQNINIFKSRLDSYWYDHPTKYTVDKEP